MRQREANLIHKAKQTASSSPIVKTAVHKLASSLEYARDVECDPWQFAVEIERLDALGVSRGALRWLVVKGYAEHAVETTRFNDPLRKFRQGRNLAFSEKSRFVITDAGLALLDGEWAGAKHHRLDSPKSPVPNWDAEGRVLCVKSHIVKQFRVPSPNQESVLSAFQEEGWPQFIHDPLSQNTDQPPKQRLRETIRGLNTNQKNVLLRFRGDGTGERVGWELIDGDRL